MLERQLASEIALALDYMHRACDRDGRKMGLIHRDISPSNILLSHEGEVKLADFGLMKATKLSDVTWGRFRKGTMAYMSPEQIIGNFYVDNRADVWAIGVMLYELLCLEVPFKGRTVHQTFDQIIHEDPVLPSKRNSGRPKRFIPSELESIAMRAMSKKPADRQQDISEVIEQIRSFRNHKLLIS